MSKMSARRKPHGNSGKKRKKETSAERLHRIHVESKCHRSMVQRHRRLALGPLNSIDVAGRRGYDEARFGISALIMPYELRDIFDVGDAYRFIEEIVIAAGGELDHELKEVWSGEMIPQRRFVELWGFVKNPGQLDLKLIRAHYRDFRKKLKLTNK